MLLKRLGLDPDKDVTIVAVGSVETRTAALVSGAIQAAVTLVPKLLDESFVKGAADRGLDR